VIGQTIHTSIWEEFDAETPKGRLRNKSPALDLSEEQIANMLVVRSAKLVEWSGCGLSGVARTSDAIGGGGIELVT
jgi:hypothetical protein